MRCWSCRLKRRGKFGMRMEGEGPVQFESTEIAFAYKNDRQLRLAYWLFRLMSRPSWADFFARVGSIVLSLRLPLSQWIIKQTIYRQFIGGESLEDCEPVIETLKKFECQVVLDYAVEGMQEESALDEARDQFIQTIHFAANHPSVPVVTIKITAIAPYQILEAWTRPELRGTDFDEKWDRAQTRLTEICDEATHYGVKVFIDAEESWIQDAIDFLADSRMKAYNRDEVYIYHTFQMYRHDRLAFLKKSHSNALAEGYILGAKLVRGAYMEKERKRAKELGYPSPISDNKQIVDRDYNEGLLFCAGHYENIALCAATHNLISSKLLADYITTLPVRNDHPHLNFCQLYGMGDDITFNLAKYGFNVAKYLPYGPVKEAFPYLVRRAEENRAMSNEFNREYQLIRQEVIRRRHAD